MVSTIPGSDILTSGLNMISQSLQIPVIIFLIIFAIFAVLSLGSLVSEYTSRRRVSIDSIEKMVYSISNAGSSQEIMGIIKNAKIYEFQKVVLVKILRSGSLDDDSREVLAKISLDYFFVIIAYFRSLGLYVLHRTLIRAL